MVKYSKSVSFILERYPHYCAECPAFRQTEYRCHNESGMCGGCELGYMAKADMRDFYGLRIWQGCRMRMDKRVKIAGEVADDAVD